MGESCRHLIDRAELIWVSSPVVLPHAVNKGGFALPVLRHQGGVAFLWHNYSACTCSLTAYLTSLEALLAR